MPHEESPLLRVQHSFARQGMMQHLGGFHGGAIGALADIAGGYAGLIKTQPRGHNHEHARTQLPTR